MTEQDEPFWLDRHTFDPCPRNAYELCSIKDPKHRHIATAIVLTSPWIEARIAAARAEGLRGYADACRKNHTTPLIDGWPVVADDIEEWIEMGLHESPIRDDKP